MSSEAQLEYVRQKIKEGKSLGTIWVVGSFIGTLIAVFDLVTGLGLTFMSLAVAFYGIHVRQKWMKQLEALAKPGLPSSGVREISTEKKDYSTSTGEPARTNYCRFCGAALRQDSIFCETCGKKSSDCVHYIRTF